MSKIHKALQKAEKEKLEEKSIAVKPVFRKREPIAEFDQHLVTLLQPKSIAAEQFRKLKATVLKILERKSGSCIMISSAVAGEGKTLTATNLAISIAQEIQQHVLLIDGDLRRPNIHKVLSIEDNMGLSEYLSGDLDLSRFIAKTSVPKLSVLTAGALTTKPAELFSSNKMKELIREVRQRYDDRYIIIDSTPVISTSEPDILARQVDGILFVVRAGKTPREVIKRSLMCFEKEKIMGLVFNEFDIRATGYHYGYYNYYGKDTK
ncbi:MAG: polysaccharide biosynthesis tyrosine autokinase [Thermodesulfobacteriota bacterium]|nr:polysaccharide biosynthesis tyrosine autokinase [Thermodesulfobacteriota bacterium]